MARYKWAHPAEWLEEKMQEAAQEGKVHELYSYAQSMMGRLDQDALQDLFQAEMAEDGYFEDLDKKENDE